MDVGNAFVLDGSVTIVWGFDDEDDAYAMAILDRMPDLTAHVPSVWSLEIARRRSSVGAARDGQVECGAGFR